MKTNENQWFAANVQAEDLGASDTAASPVSAAPLSPGAAAESRGLGASAAEVFGTEKLPALQGLGQLKASIEELKVRTSIGFASFPKLVRMISTSGEN